MDGYRRWASWDGVITLAMAAVYVRMRLAMGDVSVVLFTLGGDWSTVGVICTLCAAQLVHIELWWMVVVLVLGRR